MLLPVLSASLQFQFSLRRKHLPQWLAPLMAILVTVAYAMDPYPGHQGDPAAAPYRGEITLTELVAVHLYSLVRNFTVAVKYAYMPTILWRKFLSGSPEYSQHVNLGQMLGSAWIKPKLSIITREIKRACSRLLLNPKVYMVSFASELQAPVDKMLRQTFKIAHANDNVKVNDDDNDGDGGHGASKEQPRAERQQSGAGVKFAEPPPSSARADEDAAVAGLVNGNAEGQDGEADSASSVAVLDLVRAMFVRAATMEKPGKYMLVGLLCTAAISFHSWGLLAYYGAYGRMPGMMLAARVAATTCMFMMYLPISLFLVTVLLDYRRRARMMESVTALSQPLSLNLSAKLSASQWARMQERRDRAAEKRAARADPVDAASPRNGRVAPAIVVDDGDALFEQGMVEGAEPGSLAATSPANTDEFNLDDEDDEFSGPRLRRTFSTSSTASLWMDDDGLDSADAMAMALEDAFGGDALARRTSSSASLSTESQAARPAPAPTPGTGKADAKRRASVLPPLADLTLPSNAIAWLRLREIVGELGAGFLRRLQLFFGFFVAVCAVAVLVLVLELFTSGAHPFDTDTHGSANLDSLIVHAGVNVVYVVLMVLSVIIAGAASNQQTGKQRDAIAAAIVDLEDMNMAFSAGRIAQQMGCTGGAGISTQVCTKSGLARKHNMIMGIHMCTDMGKYIAGMPSEQAASAAQGIRDAVQLLSSAHSSVAAAAEAKPLTVLGVPASLNMARLLVTGLVTLTGLLVSSSRIFMEA